MFAQTDPDEGKKSGWMEGMIEGVREGGVRRLCRNPESLSASAFCVAGGECNNSSEFALIIAPGTPSRCVLRSEPQGNTSILTG